jgi:hypothetical protein
MPTPFSLSFSRDFAVPNAPDYEAIVNALYDLLTPVADFKTTGRRLQLWSQTPQQPALFINHPADEYPEPPVRGLPVKATIELEVWLYAQVTVDPSHDSDFVLENLVSAVKTALAPSVMSGVQTLGGIVSHCWVQGRVEFDQGYMDGGQGKAIIPVKVLVPGF